MNNLSARGAAKAKEIKSKAAGLFGRIRGKAAPASSDAGKAADEAADADVAEAADASLLVEREYDPGLFSEIRDGWVRRHMAARTADYTTYEPLAVTAAHREGRAAWLTGKDVVLRQDAAAARHVEYGRAVLDKRAVVHAQNHTAAPGAKSQSGMATHSA